MGHSSGSLEDSIAKRNVHCSGLSQGLRGKECLNCTFGNGPFYVIVLLRFLCAGKTGMC